MHEAELLAAIRANPDDDVPRMLYADALLDGTDEALRDRGKYIQISLKGGYDDWHHDNSTRIESLWSKELGCENQRPFLIFHRGMPRRMGGSVASIANAAHLIATYPIDALTCWGLDSFAPLAARPELQFIRTFEITQLGEEQIPLSTIDAIIAAPHLVPVALEVGKLLTDDGAVRWATAPWFDTLHVFTSWSSRVTARGVAVLAERGMPRLRELRFSMTSVGDAGAEALAASALGSLEKLSLDECEIGEAGARALLASSAMNATIISAKKNTFGAGVRALVRAPNVTNLDLSWNVLGAHASAIANADLPALATLVLTDNKLTTEVATAFAASPLPRLEHLDLRSNELGHAGVAPFATMTGLPALRVLGISDNNLASGKTMVQEGGDEWNPWSTVVEIELTRDEIKERLGLRVIVE